MSKYTTQVRYICEFEAGETESTSIESINEIVNKAHAKVIGNYPIFDEQYRAVLDSKILKHYYTREICEETVGLWKLRLNNRMNEIMPYYNQLYRSELLSFNPLYDFDYSTTHTRNESTEGQSTSEGTNDRNDSGSRSTDTENKTENTSMGSGSGQTSGNKNQTDRYSDTPQGGLNGMQSVENNTYLTNARIINADESNENITNYQNNGTSKDESSSATSEILVSKGKDSRENNNLVNSTESYLERVSGKRSGSSYSKLLLDYRDTFLNIDKMIIEDLNDLFFGLWE